MKIVYIWVEEDYQSYPIPELMKYSQVRFFNK